MATKRTAAKDTSVLKAPVSSNTTPSSAQVSQVSETSAVKRNTSRAKHSPATVAALPAEVVTGKTPYVPTHEDIAALAHTYFVARGHQAGSEQEDWLRAEAELRNRSL